MLHLCFGHETNKILFRLGISDNDETSSKIYKNIKSMLNQQ